MPKTLAAPIVYLLTNTKTGKRYVGKTKMGLARRWRQHLQAAANGAGFAIGAALRKHGAAAFTRQILGTFASENAALAAEQRWIARLRTMGRAGYNLCRGGRGALGVKWTAARRARTLASIRRPEARRKMSLASLAAKSVPAFRAKVSAEAIARWGDAACREVMQVAISAGQRRSHERDSTRRIRAAEARRVTLLRMNAERTHAMCRVHGPVPAKDCYAKMRGPFRALECRACARQRAAARAARRHTADERSPSNDAARAVPMLAMSLPS